MSTQPTTPAAPPASILALLVQCGELMTTYAQRRAAEEQRWSAQDRAMDQQIAALQRGAPDPAEYRAALLAGDTAAIASYQARAQVLDVQRPLQLQQLQIQRRELEVAHLGILAGLAREQQAQMWPFVQQARALQDANIGYLNALENHMRQSSAAEGAASRQATMAGERLESERGQLGQLADRLAGVPGDY